MQGKVVVMTGATSGIGEAAAESLARMGAKIMLVARDPERAEATLAKLRRAGPGVEHGARFADLSTIAGTRRVGAEIAAAEPRIDVLVNNAGAVFDRRQETREGLEMTFALNHMSYFVLTCALKDRLIAAAPSRIINTSSSAHRAGAVDFDDLQLKGSTNALPAYGRSKLCNILFTRELARRLAGTGVTANSLHPGFVATRFGSDFSGLLRMVMPAARVFALSPEKGAETIVYLASSPQVANQTGLYFERCAPARPTAAAQDDAAAARLWAESERLARAA
ncbi:MAG: SDR family oxidoreductase [Caulobacteraceae bacterium]|nr:SDR family oxidoreductase [Caulobacteraceae bacterium]